MRFQVFILARSSGSVISSAMVNLRTYALSISSMLFVIHITGRLLFSNTRFTYNLLGLRLLNGNRQNISSASSNNMTELSSFFNTVCKCARFDNLASFSSWVSEVVYKLTPSISQIDFAISVLPVPGRP